LHKPAIDFSGQAALATGASHGIASASNGCFGEIFCAARRTLLQLRANAASAMAVPAKVRFVRILPVQLERSEGSVYNFLATPWL
jgi:hypothetical protein